MLGCLLMITIDGNGAAASVAFRTSEVIAIYPITPSSTMAEQADARRVTGLKRVGRRTSRRRNAVGSRGHRCCTRRAANRGALDLLYLIAGFTADDPHAVQTGRSADAVCPARCRSYRRHPRTLDLRRPFRRHGRTPDRLRHAVRQQRPEACDFALISHIATLKSRVPFIHFFDGFRTSHEINKIAPLADDTIRNLLPQDEIDAHRLRALNPEHPVIRGTSANPDTYFQSREATNPRVRRGL